MAGVASGLHDEKIAQLVREEKEESARAEHAAADDRHVIVLIKIQRRYVYIGMYIYFTNTPLRALRAHTQTRTKTHTHTSDNERN